VYLVPFSPAPLHLLPAKSGNEENSMEYETKDSSSGLLTLWAGETDKETAQAATSIKRAPARVYCGRMVLDQPTRRDHDWACTSSPAFRLLYGYDASMLILDATEPQHPALREPVRRADVTELPHVFTFQSSLAESVAFRQRGPTDHAGRTRRPASGWGNCLGAERRDSLGHCWRLL
jgi:hypothetical protein